jgi:hypothetical protein
MSSQLILKLNIEGIFNGGDQFYEYKIKRGEIKKYVYELNGISIKFENKYDEKKIMNQKLYLDIKPIDSDDKIVFIYNDNTSIIRPVYNYILFPFQLKNPKLLNHMYISIYGEDELPIKVKSMTLYMTNTWNLYYFNGNTYYYYSFNRKERWIIMIFIMIFIMLLILKITYSLLD